MYLAVVFLIALPCDGDRVWWHQSKIQDKARTTKVPPNALLPLTSNILLTIIALHCILYQWKHINRQSNGTKIYWQFPYQTITCYEHCIRKISFSDHFCDWQLVLLTQDSGHLQAITKCRNHFFLSCSTLFCLFPIQCNIVSKYCVVIKCWIIPKLYESMNCIVPLRVWRVG